MILNYSNSFHRLERFVYRFNSRQQTTGTMVRQSMLATATAILKIYGASLIKSNKVTPIDPCNLPSLRTNNIQLAKITQASGRTIQRHIDRLLKCGMLTRKIWHGSHSSYELFINPKILWITGVGSVDKAKKCSKEDKKTDADNQEIKKSNWTKCPHSYTYKTTYKRNNRIIAVDKLENSWSLNFDKDRGLTQKTTDKTTEKEEKRSSLGLTTSDFTEKKPKKETKKTRRKDPLKEDARRKDVWREAPELEKNTARGRQTGAVEIENRQNNPGNPPFCDATRHAFLSKYVNALWSLAREVLYKDVWLNSRQCSIAKTLLYEWYEPVSNEKLEHTHQVYTDRIHLVAKYIAKDPLHRFVTLPSRYFDPKNPKGFTGTKPWYEAEKAHKTALKLERIVREQIQKFKRNEAKDTAEARPRLTVFRECEQRIGKLGIPKLTDKFYKAVFGQKINEHVNKQ